MRERRLITRVMCVGVAVLTVGNVAFADIPLMVNHQGMVKVGTTPFNGTGLFKFGFVDASGNWLWTNDNTNVGLAADGNNPTDAVSLTVTYGVYSVRLGDESIPNMVAIPSSVFDSSEVYLRVIFDDGPGGNPEEVFSPDQRFTSAPYAFHAAKADSDVVLFSYRHNCTVLPVDASTLKVLAGELAIPNVAGTDVRYRRNMSQTTVTWADIDTGSEANDTQYYVYALADDANTTFTVTISASDTVPSGATYRRKIGYFYNDSGGDITDVGNTKGGDVPNIMMKVISTDVTPSAPSYTTMQGTTLHYCSSGRPVEMRFNGLMSLQAGGWANVFCTLSVDGSEVAGTGGNPLSFTYLNVNYPARTMTGFTWIETLDEGPHEIEVLWRYEQNGPVVEGGSTALATFIVEEK